MELSEIFANKESIWSENGSVSFLELAEHTKLTENVKAEEILKLENNLKEMFMSQMINRRKKRYTDDGRQCAAAFVQDSVTYVDCTAARSPDGALKNKEWCYVDFGAKGKNWGYCKPIMDYDKVREANQKYLKELTVECRKVNDELEFYVAPAEAAINDLNMVRSGQAVLDNQVNLMSREVETINNNLLNLNNIRSEWEKVENKAVGNNLINN